MTRDADIVIAVDDADALDVVPGLTIPTATVGHLLALKLLARDDRSRPTDAADLLGLAGVASDQEWESAERAVRLIEQRGDARGRDLVAALGELRSTHGT